MLRLFLRRLSAMLSRASVSDGGKGSCLDFDDGRSDVQQPSVWSISSLVAHGMRNATCYNFPAMMIAVSRLLASTHVQSTAVPVFGSDLDMYSISSRPLWGQTCNYMSKARLRRGPCRSEPEIAAVIQCKPGGVLLM